MTLSHVHSVKLVRVNDELEMTRKKRQWPISKHVPEFVCRNWRNYENPQSGCWDENWTGDLPITEHHV